MNKPNMNKYQKPKLKRCQKCNQVRAIEAFKLVKVNNEKRHDNYCCFCIK